ncbi:MAG TPA: hypothetical protein VGK58_17550 [Lacipirellulaceae bacterium]
MQSTRTFAAAALLLLATTYPIRAAEFLKYLPGDTLGFVLARNLDAVDRKVLDLIANLKLIYHPEVMAMSPLAILQGGMGIREGLDTSGDFLLAVLPQQEGSDWPQFCVWLPVSDYDRFVAALGGSTAQKITAVSVAGIDLLVAKQGKWALVMDPDQRLRMEQMLDAAPAPPHTLKSMDWIDTQDLAVIALSSGVRDVLAWANANDGAHSADQAQAEIGDDDFFTEPGESAPPRASGSQSPAPIVTKIQLALRYWLSLSPKASQWMHEAEAICVGLRFDDERNGIAGVRVVLNANSELAATNREFYGESLPALHQGGDFIVTADGVLPRALQSAVVSAYVRSIIDEMKTGEQLDIDDATLERFYQEVDKATDMVQAFAVLAMPGKEQDGVYTNNFAAVRVTSADAFVDHAGEVMRLWNQMNREARRGTQLIFDVDEMSIGERAAREYSIDIAAADGGPALPEIRQAMEKLFGPGGKLRFFIVPVDDQTVLLAAATPEQIESILQALDVKQPNDWDRDPLGPANRLLPREADWRVFFSPNGYTKWHARKMNAITGPVFGGPVVKEFPASPPIGAAGGVNERELWADFGVPSQTIDALGTYRQPKGIRIQR